MKGCLFSVESSMLLVVAVSCGFRRKRKTTSSHNHVLLGLTKWQLSWIWKLWETIAFSQIPRQACSQAARHLICILLFQVGIWCAYRKQLLKVIFARTKFEFPWEKWGTARSNFSDRDWKPSLNSRIPENKILSETFQLSKLQVWFLNSTTCEY